MLRIIAGRAGTGKTTYALNTARELAEKGRPSITVVPEQGSYSVEKYYCEALPYEMQDLARVMSFKQLAEEVLRRYGGGAKPQLDDAGKAAMVRRCVIELGDEVPVYRRAERDAGLCTEISDAIDELRNSGATPSMLEAAADQEDSISGDRLRQLASIMKKYAGDSMEKNLDGPERMRTASQRLRESGWLSGRTVILDWFSGFTFPEQEMISAIMETADDVIVTLQWDPRIQSQAMKLSGYTAQWLKDTAASLGIGYSETVLDRVRRYRNPGAGAGEELLSLGSSEGGAGLFRIEAQDRYAEAESTAAEICRLVREEGYRYGEIAVAARDSEQYRSAVTSAFKAADIPYFADFKRNISYSPVIRFVRACVEMISQYDTAKILEIMKLPVSCVDPFDAGAAEAYAEVWDIRGDQWLTRFEKNPEGFSSSEPGPGAKKLLEAAERARSTVIGRLSEFVEKCSGASADVVLREAYLMMQKLGGLEWLSRSADQETVREANAAFGVMDSLSRILEGEAVSPEILSGLIAAEAAATSIKDIPAALDEVTVGSSSGLRLAGVKALFLLGLCEGEFPRYEVKEGLLTQEERDLLAESGASVQIGTSGSDSREYSDLYRIISVPSERLYLCRPLYDGSGQTMRSSALDGIWNKARDCSWLREPFAAVCNRATAMREAAADPEGRGAAVMEAAGLADAGALRKASKVRDFGIEDTASEETLLGKSAKLSPTRAEQYAACPLKYYFEYMLRIRTPEKADVTPISAGNFIHGTIEKVMKRLGGDLTSVSVSEMERISDEESDRQLKETVGDPEDLKPRTKKLFQKLKAQNSRLLLRIRQEMAQSGFKPVDFELVISDDGDVRPLVLTTDGGRPVTVGGRVDRVDEYTGSDGRNYIRVIDYKTGEKKFSKGKVKSGEEVQMPLYLVALCRNASDRYGNPVPAGVLYMPADPSVPDEGKNGSGGGAYTQSGVVLNDREILRAMESDGEGLFIPYSENSSRNQSAISLEEMEQLGRDAEEAIKRSVDSMYGGDISPKPRYGPPCRYCSFKTACQFQRRVKGDEAD
ncbi:MAG: PD-(D/E)XK nuclease family protein [Oscillospiraceae bacterium]|jgi:ATP-dependent helicase/nuclease subunit B